MFHFGNKLPLTAKRPLDEKRGFEEMNQVSISLIWVTKVELM
jgi:hypothetical protein